MATVEYTRTGSEFQAELAAWLQQARAGDPEAMGRIYDRTNSVVLALTLRILGRREDAEEAMLDVYTKAWQMAGRYEPDRGSVTAWLITMARSAALDRLRSRTLQQSRHEPLPDDSSYPTRDADPETQSAGGQQHLVVRSALSRLPPAQRQALEIAYFEDLSHTELAERLAIPLGTAKTRVRRGLSRLRTLLAGKVSL